MCILILNFCIAMPEHNQLQCLLHILLPNIFQKQICTILNIYTIYFMSIHRRCINIYMLHIVIGIHHVTSTTYISLTYITKLIWPPHCKYTLPSQYAIWAYKSHVFWYVCKTQANAASTSHATAKYASKINMPIKLGIYANISWTCMRDMCATWSHWYKPCDQVHCTQTTLMLITFSNCIGCTCRVDQICHLCQQNWRSS